MGHSGGDAVHKMPHKMNTHRQNQLKFSVLVWFKILNRIRYKKIDVILVQCPFNLDNINRLLHSKYPHIKNWGMCQHRNQTHKLLRSRRFKNCKSSMLDFRRFCDFLAYYLFHLPLNQICHWLLLPGVKKLQVLWLSVGTLYELIFNKQLFLWPFQSLNSIILWKHVYMWALW